MLRYKINGAILITFVAIVVLFTLIQRPFQQQRLQTVMGKVKSVLHTLVDRDRNPLANAIVDNRIREIKLRVQQMLDVEGIMAIGVFDETGNLLHSSGDYPGETVLSPAERERGSREVFIRQEKVRGEQRLVYLQEIRVIGERYGFIQISYSLADVEVEQRQAFMIFGILLGSILLVMLVLLNAILSKTIILPLEFLRDAMRRIQAGEFGEQIQIASQDEIGDLARTFNAMSQQLQQDRIEHARLNRIVKEQEQAQHRREIAEAANQAKSEFLRTISHEIRTPLNAMIGLAELARQTPHAETLPMYAERIAASGKILNALVNGVLDLAGIEAGKFSLTPADFNVRDILQTAVNPFQFGDKQDAISWNIVVDPAIPSQLYGDSTRLMQVLVNLISNAVKFTQYGTISVQVEQEKSCPEFVESLHVAEDSLWLHFSVKDTGIGIPKEEQGSIFQQFFQGQEVMRRNFCGTGGIGMTIVKKIVETMHGNIWFSSTPGIGTHVHVILPFGLTVKNTPGRTTEASLRGLRLLIAEDNSSNRLMLQNWLTHLEGHVVTAENGEAVLDCWTREDFDVILMDLQMPGIDGFQATREIRRLEKPGGRHIPIVALTAAATTDDRAQCLEAGMDEYLPKPVDIAALLHTLNTIFPERATTFEKGVEDAGLSRTDAKSGSLFSLDKMPESWKNDPAKKEKYIALMVEDIQESLYHLEQAIQDGEPTDLSKAAHKLKGALGKLRSKTVQKRIRQLEAMRRQDDFQEASVLLADLKKELQAVLQITVKR